MRFIVALLFLFLTVEAKPDPILSFTSGAKIALDLVGVSDTYFYDISALNKQQTAVVYFQDIDKNIVSIHGELRKLARKPANFVTKTLKRISKAVNQLIVDYSENASQDVIQEDIAQIEAIVNAFNAGFSKSLCTENRVLPCPTIKEAAAALQVFAHNIEIYLCELNQIVYHSSLGNQQLITSSNEVVLSLGQFVESCAESIYLTDRKL